MKCNRCGRYLKTPAVPIEQVGGAYGPRCARLLGFIAEPDLLTPRRARRRSQPKRDTNQMELPA